MQDKDNITQTNNENDEIKETARKNADALNVRQTNSENTILEVPAEESVQTQNVEEIPSVEYIGNQEEIPPVNLNAQEIPAIENGESQTAQAVEVADAPKVEEQFIFNGYELKTWEFNPRIYKIITGSTIFCVLALVAVAQSNVLNTKACDSPLVSKICQVLDTVYVGSVLLGSNKDWVNEDYDRTELGDAEITYIDTSNVSPPLPYPEGYFALANPEMNYNDPMIIPGGEFPTADGFPPATNNFPPATTPNSGFPPVTSPNPIAPGKNPITDKAKVPKRNPNAIKGTKPETGFTIEGGDDTADGEKGFPTGENKGDDKKDPKTVKKDDKTENKQPGLKSDSLQDVALNRKPLDDLGDFIKQKIKDDNVDIRTPFTIQATGKLNKEGKIEAGTYKTIKAESDDKDMIEVVQRSIAAINDSGYLGYLKDLSGKDLMLTFTQNDEKIVGVVQSEMKDESRARSIESALNLLIGIMKAKKSAENADANDKDDLELLKSATVKTDGKKIIIMFDVDKKIAHPMIERKLLAPRTDKDKPKSNSAAQTENGNSKIGK